MRRALVVLAVLVMVAGAFTAGALIFRDKGRKTTEVTLHCSDQQSQQECDRAWDRAFEAECDDGADAVKMTVVFETGGDEDARVTRVDDC